MLTGSPHLKLVDCLVSPTFLDHIMDNSKSESEDRGKGLDAAAAGTTSDAIKEPEENLRLEDDLDDLDGAVNSRSYQRVSVDSYFRQISLMILTRRARARAHSMDV